MINRILERLEREREKFDSPVTDIEDACIAEGLSIAISIVQKVAKDGGWIPCSERLPDESGEYYTYVYYDGHYMYSVDEIDCDEVLKEWNCASDYQIIAWKPIAPYQKGE